LRATGISLIGTWKTPANGGRMILIMRLSRGLILARGAMIMKKLTDDQVQSIDRAEHELRRRIQQMISTGQHSH
jgi:hypothetical protein